jgi:hypothetical protein
MGIIWLSLLTGKLPWFCAMVNDQEFLEFVVAGFQVEGAALCDREVCHVRPIGFVSHAMKLLKAMLKREPDRCSAADICGHIRSTICTQPVSVTQAVAQLAVATDQTVSDV